jgi:hypothetical protein
MSVTRTPLPGPLEQRLMRMAHHRELNHILERTLRSGHSHSMVPGGLLVMSSTTRLT